MDPSHTRHLLRAWPVRVILTLSLLWLGPSLACGSFAPRPTPTPTPVAVTPQAPAADGQGTAIQEPTPTLPPVEATPTPAPTATFTPTPLPGTALAIGQPARVTAPNGLNLRDTPATTGNLLLQLGTGQRVTIVEGPTSGEGFTWWKIDDGQGNVGWAADGDGETEWLSPRLGEPQAVNRAPRVGDRVVVSVQLSVRTQPGTDAALITRTNPGAEFTVLAGPQSADGLNWYQVRSDDGSVEGWAAEGDGVNRWMSPLE